MILSFLKYKLKQLSWASIGCVYSLILVSIMMIAVLFIEQNIYAEYIFISCASILSIMGIIVLIYECTQKIKKMKKEYYLFRTLQGQLLPPCFGIIMTQQNCKTCELSELCFLQRSLHV